MKVLLFNDTSYEQHHGSRLVMQQIFRLAAEAGARIALAFPGRCDWAADEQLKSDIRVAASFLIGVRLRVWGMFASLLREPDRGRG